MIDTIAVKEQALKELADEAFHAAVELEKEKIKKYRPFWNKIFPFIITIKRR